MTIDHPDEDYGNEVPDTPRKTRTTIAAYEMSAIAKRDLIREMLSSGALVAGPDFGTIGKQDDKNAKMVLLKPGAEKLATEFALAPVFSGATILEDFDKGLFHYRYECNLYDIESKLLVASGIGSCNSLEEKYGYRWVDQSQVPKALDLDKLNTRGGKATEFDFGVKASETSGPYGKPAAYWKQFKDAIEAGTAIEGSRETKRGMSKTWTIDTTQYSIPNDAIFSIVNTLDKMAQKRAFIAAILIACNASEFFTQDVEDMPGFDVDTTTHADPAAGTALAKTTEKPILGTAVKELVEWAGANGHSLIDVRKALGVAEPAIIGKTWRGTLEEAKNACTMAWLEEPAS